MGATTWMLACSAGDIVALLETKPALDRQATTELVTRLFPGEHLVEMKDAELESVADDDEIAAACFTGLAIIAAKEIGGNDFATLQAGLMQAFPDRTVQRLGGDGFDRLVLMRFKRKAPWWRFNDPVAQG